MSKTSVIIGGVKTTGDQEHIKRHLKQRLGIGFDTLDFTWDGEVSKGRPTVTVPAAPPDEVEILRWAIKETFGAFYVVTVIADTKRVAPATAPEIASNIVSL